MHSIRTKIGVLIATTIILVTAIITLLAVYEIKGVVDYSSKEILMLSCENGQKNLDTYYKSVSQSVEMIASYAETDLLGLSPDGFEGHVARVDSVFMKMADNTDGVMTYYYRIDPEFSDTVKGFWYVNLDGKGFKEHEVTDITLYDTNDQSKLVWFTVPKATGSPVWLPPYSTDNLDHYVISYNVPIHKDGRFVGVIGIEIDYKTIVDTISDIKVYKNGYAYISDEDGNIICHPLINLSKLIGKTDEKVPYDMKNANNYINYNYKGVEKQAVWLPLSSGMRINVAVPTSEINANWRDLIIRGIIVSLLLLVASILLTMRLAQHITKPLKKLTEAAEKVNKGDYDIELNYEGNDEVGILSKTFTTLINHIKNYVGELSNMAYKDALTSAYNNGAFEKRTAEIDDKINSGDGDTDFAVCMFDCNDLKSVNDQFGHKKGDLYIKNTFEIISDVFKNSSVFRVGGDEFAVILTGDNYENREALTQLFKAKLEESKSSNISRWEQISVAIGMAEYNPKTDSCVDDVIRRADKNMYFDKRENKRR
ncbi:MAG: diguanylate cyclase [Clostridia bacterium]|nr:diguanylate cyclase [Clostridia bacterium]